jgi:2-polyprenyl-3-methyl-5-hydroxy-6-metoxy-1,4-benzoquinol methylase
MGYMRQKYNSTYILKEDPFGNQTPFGIEGVDEFRKGGIRKADYEILRSINFKEMDVLEFGFGRGEAIKYSIDNGASRVVGVDFSKDANDIAKEFLSHYGIKAHLFCEDSIVFLKAYIEKKAYNPFHIVLMLDFVEHVPRAELKELLILLHKVLTDNAVIAINTPVFGVDNDVVLEGLKLQARDTGDEFEETVGMHCNRYTKESLESFMKENGYQVVSGHFFIAISSTPEPLEGIGQVKWSKIFNRGYPVKEKWEPAKFEYAYSYFQLYQQLQQEHQNLQQEHRVLQQSRAVIFARKLAEHPLLMKLAEMTYEFLVKIYRLFRVR